MDRPTTESQWGEALVGKLLEKRDTVTKQQKIRLVS